MMFFDWSLRANWNVLRKLGMIFAVIKAITAIELIQKF